VAVRENVSFRVTIQVDPGYASQVDESSLQDAAAAALRHRGAPTGAALTLVVTGDKEICQLNRQFRHIGAPTDVLAFPAAAPFIEVPGQPPYLGDVIISHPRAAAQAAEAGHPIKAELALLAVHGTLHLLGYDHATPVEKAVMWAAQEAILAELGLELSTEIS
jgi:probable rRNA maturation factor